MRRASRLTIVLVSAAAILPASRAGGQGAAPLDAYRGLGAWVDLFDPGLYAHPEDTVADLASRGVHTLFLETASYRLPGPIRFPEEVGRFLDAAHEAGILVVAWYVPDFVDLERDFEWSMAAVGFTSPSGHRFDSFGLDIEVTAVRDPTERAARVVELSGRLREAVGPGYPLGAITPAPLRSAGYWAVFPDAELASIYDVYLPMAYWAYHVEGEGPTYDYVTRSADQVRADTGRSDIPIHVIGGIADRIDAEEMAEFVRAVNDQGLIGASVYDVATSDEEDWAALAGLRFEEPGQRRRDRPERLRLGEDLGTYGRIAGADRTFEEEVPFVTGPLAGPWELDLEAFGPSGGGSVTVNGMRAASVPPSGRGWSPRLTIGLPDEALRDDGPNAVAFVAPGGKAPWAVRRVTLVAPPLGLDDRQPRGALPQSDPGRGDRVTYAFRSSDGRTVAVTVRGFDLVADEVRVALNGETVSVLPPTDRSQWGEPVTILLDPRAGPNLLTLDGLSGPGDPWGVRLDGAVPAALA